MKVRVSGNLAVAGVAVSSLAATRISPTTLLSSRSSGTFWRGAKW